MYHIAVEGLEILYIVIGPHCFFFSNLPSKWLQSKTGNRLNAFIAPPTTAPPSPTFKVKIVNVIEHPPLQSFKRIRKTLYFNDIPAHRYFYITDDMKSVVNWDSRELKIEIFPHPTDSELDEMGKILIQLRLLTSYLSVSENGLPLHCSGVHKNGSALVFFGTSGAGKSTIAHLMQHSGWNLLNDEYNLILPIGDTYRIFSTPFSRKEYCCVNHPSGITISGMFHLNHEDFLVEQIPPELQMRLLFQSVYMFPDYSRFNSQLLETIDAIRSKTVVQRLHFRNDAATATLLENHCEATCL